MNLSLLRIHLFLLVLIGFFINACGGRFEPPEDNSVKSLSCKPMQRIYTYDEIAYGGGKSNRLSYEDIRSGIMAACMNCHQAPSDTGGFSFIDSYKGEVRTIGGKTQFYPGFFEIAENVSSSLLHPDPDKRMPPAGRRKNNPESFIHLGEKVNAWIAAGKPQSSFGLEQGNTLPIDKLAKMKGSESGECIPNAEVVGFDYAKDRKFSNLKKLPSNLNETDLFSLDAFELAKKGTVAYTVEYPLWADNNGKGRWIHLPHAWQNGILKRQAIQYNRDTDSFEIPENTRLYKNFYKKVKRANGTIRYKRIETRIILVRKPWDKSLFGSYKWDDQEQAATLVENPYRDGSSFKDTLFPVVIDEGTGKTRDYAIPGGQRCIDCHMGSESKSFVLGASPLQWNRRSDHADQRVGLSDAEVTQLKRFIDYGMIENAPALNAWPKLEDKGQAFRNEYEERAQGYVMGNCYHCHNPNGLAFTPENGITLNLGPGALAQFNTKTRSTQIPTRLIVHQNGDLDQSHIWRKISDTSAQLGMTSQMPMNSAGGPDCNALRAIGKWIRSFESLQAAESFEPECKKENEFKWIDQDFTVAESSSYVPKRSDWKDSSVGMPDKYRSLQLSPLLADAIRKTYPVGYWNKKEVCSFPDVPSLPADQIRPWMMKGTQPKRPFGEVYTSTPGAWYYRTSCMKCHGANADGNSSLAKGILNWSGGSVRVANFMGGMFGNGGKNLKIFDQNGVNLAPNYMIWMAMEGTRVQFPPELSSFLGKHGGQMLNQMREKCLNQISPEKPSSPQFMDHEIFSEVCFIGNRSKSDPDLKFDPRTNKALNPSAVEEWADKAAFNIGFAIFDFLKESSEKGMPPSNEQCEKVYPKSPNGGQQ